MVSVCQVCPKAHRIRGFCDAVRARNPPVPVLINVFCDGSAERLQEGFKYDSPILGRYLKPVSV